MGNMYTDDTRMLYIDGIIRGSYVKYSVLKQLTYQAYGNTSIESATELNVFIDLYSVLKAVFSEHNRVEITDYTSLTSSVINLCGHYRQFFNTLSVKTKFYMVFSFNTCELNRKFVAEYNNIFLGKSQIKQFRELADSNLKLLKILVPYLPDIHLVVSDNNYESSVIISHLIDTYCQGQPNLIISKDVYPIQLCALHQYTSYLRPIKYQGQDHSIMLTVNEKPDFNFEFWKTVLLSRHNFSSETFNKVAEISPINFPLFSALYKFPERDIPLLFRINLAVDIIKSIVGGENIKIQPQQLFNIPLLTDNVQVAKIESRLKTLDVEFMKSYYRLDPESKVINLENLRDDAAVNHICAKFFRDSPINLSLL